MFKKVLVALDGSRLAETALPYAAELAHSVSSEEVILLRVVEGGGSRDTGSGEQIFAGPRHGHGKKHQRPRTVGG
jgi:nucleotide-binding universal stress UspA family protein